MICYNNIKIIIATKHNKAKAIKQRFAEQFAAKTFVPSDDDTDQFGPLTGEIARVKTAYETVIEKARFAAMQYGFYAIATDCNP